MFMKSINTGRLKWMCDKCYKMANIEVVCSAGAIKRRKIVREEKNKR